MRDRFKLVGGSDESKQESPVDTRTHEECMMDLFKSVLAEKPIAITIIVDTGQSMIFKSYPDIDAVEVGQIIIAHKVIDRYLRQLTAIDEDQ
jgi:hypothetical protein